MMLAPPAGSDGQTSSPESGAAATGSGAVLNLAQAEAELQLMMLGPPAGSHGQSSSSDSEAAATGSGAVLNLAQAEAELQLMMLGPPAGPDGQTSSSDSEAAEADNSQTGDISAGAQSSPRPHSSGGSSAGTSSGSSASDSTASGSTASGEGGSGADSLAQADPAAAAAADDPRQVEFYVQRKDQPWFPNSEHSVIQVSYHPYA